MIESIDHRRCSIVQEIEGKRVCVLIVFSIADLGSPFFPGGPELWHHPLAYSTAGELPGTLQHATLVHPALHPQVPVRSYLWLSADKALEPPTSAPMHVSDTWSLYSIIIRYVIAGRRTHLLSRERERGRERERERERERRLMK